jgi:hypothetical protein
MIRKIPTRVLRARLIKYEQCRDAKCTPGWIMDKELKKYGTSLKRKCGSKYARMTLKRLKNVTAAEWRVHNKCTSKHYNESRYNKLAEKQTRCVRKNCNHMKLFYSASSTS